jgi:hypothetical protein
MPTFVDTAHQARDPRITKTVATLARTHKVECARHPLLLTEIHDEIEGIAEICIAIPSPHPIARQQSIARKLGVFAQDKVSKRAASYSQQTLAPHHVHLIDVVGQTQLKTACLTPQRGPQVLQCRPEYLHVFVDQRTVQKTNLIRK